MSSEPIPIEHYARMRAEMDAGVLRDDVLARAGVTAEAWTSAQRAWLERMGSELERGRFELTQRYSHAFVERQRELAAASSPRVVAAPAPDAPHADRAEAPASPAPSPIAIAPAAPPMGVAAAASASPWAQGASAAPEKRPAPKQDLARTAGVDFAAIRAAAIPFMHAASPPAADSVATSAVAQPPAATEPAPAAPPPAPKPRAQFELGGTRAVDASALRAAALPFMHGGAGGALPDVGSPKPGTGSASASSPTAPNAAVIPASGAPTPAASPAPAIPKPRSKFDLGGTSAVDAKALRAAALPFMRGAAGGAPSNAAPASPAPAASAPGASPKPDTPLGATSALPENLSELARSVLPFAGDAKAAAPATPAVASRPPELGLTLQQYAFLCAELAAAPAEADAAFRRHGLHTAESRVEVDRVWKERLGANPSEYAQWLEHYQRRQAELDAQKTAR